MKTAPTHRKSPMAAAVGTAEAAAAGTPVTAAAGTSVTAAVTPVAAAITPVISTVTAVATVTAVISVAPVISIAPVTESKAEEWVVGVRVAIIPAIIGPVVIGGVTEIGVCRRWIGGDIGRRGRNVSWSRSNVSGRWCRRSRGVSGLRLSDGWRRLGAGLDQFFSMIQHLVHNALGNPLLLEIDNIGRSEVIDGAGVLDVTGDGVVADLCLAEFENVGNTIRELGGRLGWRSRIGLGQRAESEHPCAAENWQEPHSKKFVVHDFKEQRLIGILFTLPDRLRGKNIPASRNSPSRKQLHAALGTFLRLVLSHAKVLHGTIRRMARNYGGLRRPRPDKAEWCGREQGDMSQ
jgi:hypothetical protein